MSDQTDYLEEKIISKKGQPVPCRYRQHFAWDRELPLCIALDFVFKITLAPGQIPMVIFC